MTKNQSKLALEKYFAEHYPKKSLELGEFLSNKSFKDLRKTPLRHYFSSGRYKELNDEQLESLWQTLRKKELRWNLFALSIILFFYITNSIV